MINYFSRSKYRNIFFLFFLTALVIGLAIFFLNDHAADEVSDLSDSQTTLYEQHFALVRNRVAFVEYIQGYTKAGQDPVADDQLLDQFKRTRADAVEVFSRDPEVDFSHLGDAADEMSTDYPEMKNRAIEVLNGQEKLINKINFLDGIFSELRSFRPENIRESDLRSNREQLINDAARSGTEIRRIRITVEKECVQDVFQELADLGPVSCLNITQEMLELEDLLERFTEELGSQQQGSATELLDSIVEKNRSITTRTSRIYQRLFLSDKTVQLLKLQTDLILKYKFYLDRSLE